VPARIQVCGRLVLELDGARLEGRLPGRQGRLVVVYLATNRHRAVGRAQLVDALWPHMGPADPEAALTVVISKVRAALGHGAIEGRSDLRLALPDAWVDLEAADEAIHRAEAAVSRGDWAAAWAPARVALGVAERGFLPDHDAEWVVERRLMLEEVRLRALGCVGRAGLGLDGLELTAAERAGRALVRLSPYRETGHRILMEALTKQGDIAEALRVYEELRVRLREKLGSTPSRETQDLHRRLLRDEGEPAIGVTSPHDRVSERSR
jgi:pentatricopeptide repeat protein